MVVAQAGLGSIWSAIGTFVAGGVKAVTGGGSQTLTVPAECMTFDAVTQLQCAQMKAAAASQPLLQAEYVQWVQQQQTWQTVKQYAPYAAIGVVGIIALSMLKKKKAVTP